MNIGRLLRSSRKRAGLTQEDMSELICISRSSISKIERNHMALPAEDFVRWLQVVRSKISANTTMIETSLYVIHGVDINLLVDMLLKATAVGLIGFLF